MKRGSFALVCESPTHAGTLERAIQQALRGFAVIFDDPRGELTIAGAEAGLRVTNRVALIASSSRDIQKKPEEEANQGVK